ncbi:MAG: lamin tail domain-containing protein, partial [Gemmatimonadaceae bacterium]
MRIIKSLTFGSALAVVAAMLASCSPLAELPTTASTSPRKADGVTIQALPQLVISQVYGGGGNGGSTYKNDFVELFNPNDFAVNVSGWSVQYTSAGGTNWAATNLTGSIQPGHYYLVQEAQGAGGSTNLPTPDATGSLALSATAGKVALASSTTLLTTACPANVVDAVSFGTTASDCGSKMTPAPSNTNAVIRGDNSCAYTGDLSKDFSAALPNPRNSAVSSNICPVTQPAGPLDHVLIVGPNTVSVGGIAQFTATPQDANNATVTTATLAWLSSDPNTATVDATGKVTGVASNTTPVTITVTATSGNIVKTNSAQITVGDPVIAFIDISAGSSSFPPGFQAQLFPTARVSPGGAVVPATFVFEALDPTIATIANVANTGLVTSVSSSTTKPRFKVTATPVGGGTPY